MPKPQNRKAPSSKLKGRETPAPEKTSDQPAHPTILQQHETPRKDNSKKEKKSWTRDQKIGAVGLAVAIVLGMVSIYYSQRAERAAQNAADSSEAQYKIDNAPYIQVGAPLLTNVAIGDSIRLYFDIANSGRQPVQIMDIQVGLAMDPNDSLRLFQEPCECSEFPNLVGDYLANARPQRLWSMIQKKLERTAFDSLSNQTMYFLLHTKLKYFYKAGKEVHQFSGRYIVGPFPILSWRVLQTSDTILYDSTEGQSSKK